MDLVPDCKAGSGQNTLEFLVIGLMCEHGPRGVSKQRRGTKTCTIIYVIAYINVTKAEYSRKR